MFDFTTGVVITLAASGMVGVWIYNLLVKERNQVANAWSDIDVQLVRRHDLVPQLVSAVRGYANYEKATLTAVTELRTQSEHAASLPVKAAAEDAIETGIHRLVAIAEDYPDLKADQNFRQLSTSLTEIEDHLQYARRFYNGAVRILNTRIASFPHLLLASLFGFREAEFFEAEAAADHAPKIELE
jgi:LemA protein